MMYNQVPSWNFSDFAGTTRLSRVEVAWAQAVLGKILLARNRLMQVLLGENPRYLGECKTSVLVLVL
jgi:hypothetical protein